MTYTPPDDVPAGSNGRPPGAGVPESVWTVGPWRVDAGTGELRRNGPPAELQRVEPKVAEVLVYLARRAGKVVGRDELLAAVWPRVVVGDDALTQAVIKLRKALGDDARRPTYIETLAKRGYRLIASVAPASPVVPASTVAEVSRAAPLLPEAPVALEPHDPWWLGGLAGAIVTVTVTAGVLFGDTRDWAWPIGGVDPTQTVVESLPVIAVLPLVNASGDPAREFFSDDVGDEIIHALGRYSGLRVISRNSVQQFKQREASPQVVSTELGARYVVTGSVRELDGQVRVAVELSDAQTARVLWSERFDRRGGEVFAIQDSVVQAIVGALAVKVIKLESDRAANRPPSQREAYDLVLLARARLAQAERGANRQGRALVAKARELAPDYAMTYVVESELEEQRADLGWIENAAHGLELAERAARRALTFDDPGTSARAHAQLGRIHSLRREHDLALAESERARALNPSDPFIAEVRAETLLWTGRSQEAVALLEGALRLDPAGRHSPVRQVIVVAYFAAERYPEALAACERALAEHPDLPMLHTMRAALMAQAGRPEEARRSVAEVRRLQPNFPVTDFGTRFADPALRERFQAALRSAGF